MKRRVTLLYAVLSILVVQILVLVLFVEDLGQSKDSPPDFEINERAAAPFGLLHGKRTPRVILESYGKLKNSRGPGFSTALLQRLSAASEVVTTPTLKSSASDSKQVRPVVSAGVRSRLHGDPGKPKFIFQTATVAKANASPVPVHGKDVSEDPRPRQVQERLKVASQLQNQWKHNASQDPMHNKEISEDPGRAGQIDKRVKLVSQFQKHYEGKLKSLSKIQDHEGQNQAKEVQNVPDLNQQKHHEELVKPPSAIQDQKAVEKASVKPVHAEEQPQSASNLHNQQKHEEEKKPPQQSQVKMQFEKEHEKHQLKHTPLMGHDQKKQNLFDKDKMQEPSKSLSMPQNQGQSRQLIEDGLDYKQREERLKPPSMLKTFGGDGHSDEEAMRRNMERRDQQRRAEIFERAMEEKKEREKQMLEQKKEAARRSKLRRTEEAENRKTERQKMIREYLKKEKERAKELNDLWERRKRDGVEQPDQDEAKPSNPLAPTNSKTYFKELCETTKEPYVECSRTPKRNLTAFEAAGNDIMFTMRTTLKYHSSRLPVLFDTWLSEIEPTSVFIVTDGDDEDLIWNTRSLGMHYVNIESYQKETSRHSNQTTGTSHGLSDLCCKAGVELELFMAPENSKFNWFCHVDDDMYINLKPLVTTLAHFDPRKEAVYFGNSGSTLDEPRQVRNDSLIGRPGTRYHFAVGGMYCLSRVMLEQATPYLVGCNAFRKSCSDAKEPEDVTVGLIVGAVLNKKLHRTSMIYTHGLDLLSGSPTIALREQIAFSYGYGADATWSIIPNVIYVPGGLFNIDEDISQFRSLHCYFYPTLSWCVEKKQDIIDRKKRGDVLQCPCEWKKLICCQVYKENYQKYMGQKMLASREKDHPPERLAKEKDKEKETG